MQLFASFFYVIRWKYGNEQGKNLYFPCIFNYFLYLCTINIKKKKEIIIKQD